MKLATLLLAAALVLPASLILPSSAMAQAAAPDLKTMSTSAEVQDLIAKAKAQPPKPLINQPIVGTGAYRANLEYRAGPPAPASIHDNENELMYFVEGTGTLTSGGTLVDGTRSNPANQSGSGISGGTPMKVGPGSVAIVPAGVPHQIAADAGSAIAVMTFHVPQPWPGR
jgi:mannose-6-phosphate isomerase-like protein (cupin superfamily)